MVDSGMTSQPHDLAREFQTTHNAHVKRGFTRGMKVIKKWQVMRIKDHPMSERSSLDQVFICLKEKFEEF
ncbi:MAG: hypothetical protein PV344_02765 [Anaplasma sp.]|nr:hypothetical protein [Anaplasma sp.]